VPDFSSLSPGTLITLLFVLGLIVGSFLNVVIHRLPIMMEQDFRAQCAALDLPDDAPWPERPRYNLAVPRSACPQCQTPIAAYDNIPVLSWLWLRGHCRHCKAPISARYPAIELTTGLLSVGLALHFGPTVQLVGALLCCWILLALVFIDADTYLLPDALTLPLMWLGLAFNLGSTFAPLHAAVLGAMAGYLSLWSVYWLFKLATGKEGMGYGDFKLLAALGAWFGVSAILPIILISAIAGTIIGVSGALLARRGWGKPLPFGPYLAIAGGVVMVYGPQIQLWLRGG
jgi:leader peptidase (prepilin peptidase)/N-methyltransferase